MSHVTHMNESCRTQTGQWEASATLVNRLVQTYKHIYPQNWPILGVLQCVAARCSALQCVACRVSQPPRTHTPTQGNVLHCVACHVRQPPHTNTQTYLSPELANTRCVAVFCSVLQATFVNHFIQIHPCSPQNWPFPSVYVYECVRVHVCVSLSQPLHLVNHFTHIYVHINFWNLPALGGRESVFSCVYFCVGVCMFVWVRERE